MSKIEELTALKSECLACRKCSIGGCRVDGQFLSNVFSNMNYEASIMVVGQNPGRDETEHGEPFVGTSGKMFDQLLDEVLGMNRAFLYISNCVRCATPESRKPTLDEINNCEYFLEKEISILKPRVIITLGGPAFHQLTGMNGVTRHHGTPVFSPRYKVYVFPLFHPSPVNLNDPEKLAVFVEDLVKLEEFLGQASK